MKGLREGARKEEKKSYAGGPTDKVAGLSSRLMRVQVRTGMAVFIVLEKRSWPLWVVRDA